MKFNVEIMKEISRPMTEDERLEIDTRNENREWLALSAKFALLLRHILRTEKMTQKELAERMGVSCVQVTKLLSGKENIGLQTIAKVEKALGRNLVAFYDSRETPASILVKPTFTQVFSFPLYYAKSESFDVRAHAPENFSRLSSGKILV